MIDGRLEGDVHATERVELAAKARVQGNVHYRVVEMHAGAQLTGRLVHADAGQAASTGSDPRRQCLPSPQRAA
jgi:cytoskeletal protein CcmA (bactofilin family)